jgi:PadR family transcriptional regulator AphA
MAAADAELTRWCVLAIAVERPRHGWAIAAEMAPGSDLGRVWSVSRQLVYRAVATLETEGLLRRGTPEPGVGPERSVVSPTAKGREAVTEWLERPAEHLRDLRTEFLCKLVLRRRRGMATTRFVRRQRRHLDPVLEALLSLDEADPVDLWRKESARAAIRFLDELG